LTAIQTISKIQLTSLSW